MRESRLNPAGNVHTIEDSYSQIERGLLAIEHIERESGSLPYDDPNPREANLSVNPVRFKRRAGFSSIFLFGNARVCTVKDLANWP
jgi:hypothetical protein